MKLEVIGNAVVGCIAFVVFFWCMARQSTENTSTNSKEKEG
tara:strand:- start:219 stop:341 length:123 start_codon:yes stop_codon:yes gene_type:complete